MCVSGLCLIAMICMQVWVRADCSTFQYVDANLDGMLTLSEVRQGLIANSGEAVVKLRRLFNEVDLDGDGLLVQAEAAELFRMIATFESETSESCRLQARGPRCLAYQLDELARLRYYGVLDT
mmetsp:Transcript_56506/g.151114  ORF Transcript_56506/g.151114 Transcript_56506/m.151114 type:complete len:123 (-) Transcript_56506:81-449(-)